MKFQLWLDLYLTKYPTIVPDSLSPNRKKHLCSSISDASGQPLILIVGLILIKVKKLPLFLQLTLFVNPESMEAIQRIGIPSIPRKDRIIWIKDAKGNFTVKSSFQTNQNLGMPITSSLNWKTLWKLKLQERVKMLIWRIGSNVLPTKLNLAQRIEGIDLKCPLCNEEEESITHLFCSCPVSRAIWFGVCWSIHSDNLNVSNHQELAILVIDPPIIQSNSIPEKTLKVQAAFQVALTLDCIWQLRNQKCLQVARLVYNLPLKILSLEFWNISVWSILKLKVLERCLDGLSQLLVPRWAFNGIIILCMIFWIRHRMLQFFHLISLHEKYHLFELY